MELLPQITTKIRDRSKMRSNKYSILISKKGLYLIVTMDYFNIFYDLINISYAIIIEY